MSGEACSHTCSQCGMGGQNLAFDIARRFEIQILRNRKTERYRVHQMGGGVINAYPISEQIELPPPPPVVWLVYKNGGSYRAGDSLQGVYDSEEGAKDSVRFSVKEERASLARRLGQPVTPHNDPEPELRWQAGHHWRYGPIPGEYHAEAGLANYCVKRYEVPAGYLPDTKWCVVPHVTEEKRPGEAS